MRLRLKPEWSELNIPHSTCWKSTLTRRAEQLKLNQSFIWNESVAKCCVGEHGAVLCLHFVRRKIKSFAMLCFHKANELSGFRGYKRNIIQSQIQKADILRNILQAKEHAPVRYTCGSWQDSHARPLRPAYSIVCCLRIILLLGPGKNERVLAMAEITKDICVLPNPEIFLNMSLEMGSPLNGKMWEFQINKWWAFNVQSI